MRIDRIDRYLEVCKAHLESTGSWNTEIESLLAGTILVIAYAEFETLVNSEIQRKADSLPPEKLQTIQSNDGSLGHRGLLTSQLAHLLEQIDASLAVNFKSRRTANQRAETFYNNIVTDRHQLAHGPGAIANFGDVERFYEEGHVNP